MYLKYSIGLDVLQGKAACKRPYSPVEITLAMASNLAVIDAVTGCL